MTIEAIEFANAYGNDVEVTIRGDAEKIIQVLVGGLPREALLQLKNAMQAELAKRRDEAQSGDTPKA